MDPLYRISKFEYTQYEAAEKLLNELKEIHAEELQRAYDNIGPTVTRIDYELGEIYPETIRPEDYAIYLVELREKNEKEEEYWKARAEAYDKALKCLTDQEKEDLCVYKPGNIVNKKRAQTKVEHRLAEVIESIPHLQRKKESSFEDVEEYDKQIDNLTDEELFSDYWSLDEQLEKEGVRDKCYYLRDVHEMTYKQIGELIGITSLRAKEIIQARSG